MAQWYHLRILGMENSYMSGEAIDPLKTIKLGFLSQMKKSYSKNWSGCAFLGKISYEILTFWKKWSAGTIFALSAISRFLTKIPKNAKNFWNFKNIIFSKSCHYYTLVMGLVWFFSLANHIRARALSSLGLETHYFSPWLESSPTALSLAQDLNYWVQDGHHEGYFW